MYNIREIFLSYNYKKKYFFYYISTLYFKGTIFFII